MTSFLERYQSGDREQVWTDLVALGPQVRQQPYHSDALAVARETMQRARHNIEIIIQRLDKLGYKFANRRNEAAKSLRNLEGLRIAMAAVWEQTRDWRKSVETPGVYGDKARESLLKMFQGVESTLSVSGLYGEVMARLQQKSRVPETSNHLLDPDVYSRAPDDTAEMIDALEAEIKGLIPISLRAWYETIGRVSLMGTHPVLCFQHGDDSAAPAMYVNPFCLKYPHGAQQVEALRNSGVNIVTSIADAAAQTEFPLADPLVVVPLASCLEDVKNWQEDGGSERAQLVLAPDDLHKADISGGDYYLEVPDPAADAVFHDWRKTTFVNYLRICFRWGGFPGWERYANRPEKELSSLAEALLPI